MTTTTQAQQDRHAYLELSRISRHLAMEARGQFAVSVNTLATPELGEYAEKRRQILQAGYDRMGHELHALAEDAKAKADTYFALLTGEQQ